MAEERLLRFAAPSLYEKMVEILAVHHLHPHDVISRLVNTDKGLEIDIRFTADFTQFIKIPISSSQVSGPDEEVLGLFREAAEKCKKHIMADYYKMIKL